MKISIISPCYNAEQYLPEMIKSILQQSYKNFELIIVNDGSTDNSLQIIKNYKNLDSRIILIDQKNSGKPSIARNVGIKKSSGQIITFLDSDDIYDPNRLNLIITAFSMNPTINVVIHDYDRISAHGDKLTDGIISSKWQEHNLDDLFKPLEGHLYQSIGNLYLGFLTTFFMVHTSSIAFKKQAYSLESILFDETLIYYEDLLKWSQLAINQNVVYIPQVLSSYRDTPGGLISNSKDFDLGGIDFYENQLQQPLCPLSDDLKKILRNKLIIEYRNSLYSVACNGEFKNTLMLSLNLLKMNLTLTNLKLTFKSIVSSLKNKL